MGTEPSARTTGEARVLLVGNPNAGKSTLFNALTGAQARVGNFPGITVQVGSAGFKLPGGESARLLDLPGSYSLAARSTEERIAVEALTAPFAGGSATPARQAAVLVLDATSLRRGLYLATQVLDGDLPCVIALSMMDEARALGLGVKVEQLASALGCPVVGVVAPKKEGLSELLKAIEQQLATPTLAKPTPFSAELEAEFARLAEAAPGAATGSPRNDRLLAQWALLSRDKSDDEPGRADFERFVERAASASSALAEQTVIERYAHVDRLLEGVLAEEPARPQGAPQKTRTTRIDDILVHPFWGLIAFLITMFVVFQALFAWAEPLTGLIEDGTNAVKDFARGAIPPGPFNELVTDGVIAGVGNVLVFIPQIAILFAFLTLLEDSGYLARVAFVIDRVMGRVGLNGRAFVPLLSGFACAIPAVLATRTLERKRDRLLVMLVVPIMSCSARLPVYVLLTSVAFDREAKVLGVLSQGALVLFAMYLLSAVLALTAAAVLGRTVLKGSAPTLVLELPRYRMPRLRNLFSVVGRKVSQFVTDAGTVILALTIVLWALLNYPRSEGVHEQFEARRTAAAEIADEAERLELTQAVDAEEAGERLRSSAGGLGRAIEPAIRPLGFDWKIGVGLIGSFAAREVFVSTLALVYNRTDASEESESLHQTLREAKHAGGSAVFTPLSSISLMVFFVLAAQCMSTVAIVKRESGSWKWAVFMVVYMTAAAYLASLLVYQGGKLLGFA
jgi:ferrous iron transport protein B